MAGANEAHEGYEVQDGMAAAVQPHPEGRLPPGELAYHQRVQGEYRNALAAWEAWAAFLREHYTLQAGDTIDERGVLWRLPAAEPEAPAESAEPEAQEGT